MIVIDASTLAKYVLHEDGWDEVSRYIKEVKPLYSVDHVLKEVANAIWKHTLTGIISLDLAMHLYESVEKLVTCELIVLEDELRYMRRAFEIAFKYDISVYDALYVASSERHGELLTSDEKQGIVARDLGIKVHMIP